jgi:hypothetical protein
MASGSCACGKIEYRLTEAPKNATACHCVKCRNVFSAPYGPWVGVPNTVLTWIVQPDLVERSDIAERGYCSSCRTPITMVYFAQQLQRTCLSAAGMGLPIKEHIFLKEKAEGFDLPEDGAARYQEFDPPFEKILQVWRHLADLNKAG